MRKLLKRTCTLDYKDARTAWPTKILNYGERARLCPSPLRPTPWILAILTVSASSVFAAELYKSVDKVGNVIHSDRVPSDALRTTVLRVSPSSGVWPIKENASISAASFTGTAPASSIAVNDSAPPVPSGQPSNAAQSASAWLNRGAGASNSSGSSMTGTASKTQAAASRSGVEANSPTILAAAQTAVSPAPSAPTTQAASEPIVSQSAETTADDSPRTSAGSGPTVGQTFITGVVTRFGQGVGNIATLQNMIRSANAESIRDHLFWSPIERSRGVFDFLSPDVKHGIRAINEGRALGIDPIVQLAYGNPLYGSGLLLTDLQQDAFVRYAVFVATQLKGKVFKYEIWNEWNINYGGIGGPGAAVGDPVAYARLLRKVYGALKAVDPQITVIAGAFAGGDDVFTWLEALLQQGAANYMDVFSVHPYNYWAGEAAIPERSFFWMDKARAVMLRYSPSRQIPLYVTEIGWPTYQGAWGVDTPTQADFVTRFHLLAAGSGYVKGVWWFEFTNDGPDISDIEQNFGLIGTTYTPKPAYCALREVGRLLATSLSVQVGGPVGVDLATNYDGVRVLRMPQTDGSYAYAIWIGRKGHTVPVVLQTHDRPSATFRVAGVCKAANSYSAVGQTGIRFTANASPTVIYTDAPNLLATIVR